MVGFRGEPGAPKPAAVVEAELVAGNFTETVASAENYRALVSLIESAEAGTLGSFAYTALLDRAKELSNNPGEDSKKVIEAIVTNHEKFCNLSEHDALRFITEVPADFINHENRLEIPLRGQYDLRNFSHNVAPFGNHLLFALVRLPEVSNIFTGLGEGIFSHLLEEGPDFSLVLNTEFYDQLDDSVKTPVVEMLKRVQASRAAMTDESLMYQQHTDYNGAAFDLATLDEQISYIQLIIDAPEHPSDGKQKHDLLADMLKDLGKIFPLVDTPAGKQKLVTLCEATGHYRFVLGNISALDIPESDHQALIDRAIQANQGAAVAEHRDKLTGVEHSESIDTALFEQIFDQPRGPQELAYYRNQFSGIPAKKDPMLWDSLLKAGAGLQLMLARETYTGIEAEKDFALAEQIIEAGFALEFAAGFSDSFEGVKSEDHTRLVLMIVKSMKDHAAELIENGVSRGRTNASRKFKIEATEQLVELIRWDYFPGVTPNDHSKIALAIIASGRGFGFCEAVFNGDVEKDFHDLNIEVFKALWRAGVTHRIHTGWFSLDDSSIE